VSGRSDLGLPDDAPLETVRARFRALAKLAHPDVGGSAAEFIRVRDAYRRALREARRSIPNLDDAFANVMDDLRADAEDLFRKTGHPNTRPGRAWTKAEAIEHDLLKQRPQPWSRETQTPCSFCAATGVIETPIPALNTMHRARCHVCRGKGYHQDPETCLRCGGSGRVTLYDTIPARFARCPSCGSTGKIRANAARSS
jgi:transcription elongation factor Elf1